MAKVYLITEEEMQFLIDGLELTKLRKKEKLPAENTPEKAMLDDHHRAFHYSVVRWTQAMGYKGFRS